jgi:ParB family chromosome partitioning protein
MAENRRGLGRGLSALLGESEVGGAPGPGTREIPIELIRPNPGQPRIQFDQDEMEDLAASIRRTGVLQPILLRPHPGAPGEYQIVAGERRWRAAQKAGLAAVPAVVRALGDVETLEAALIENLQRSDLNALEEASAYASLMGLGGATQDQVAEAVGKSRSHVANTLRLLQLAPQVQELIRGGKLSAGHARAALASTDPEGLARRIVAEGLSVREAEGLARRSAGRSPRQIKPKNWLKSADTRSLERDISERLGLSVQIEDREGRGEVRIRYESLEQLDDLLRRLSGK